jgi:hypothetical protein
MYIILEGKPLGEQPFGRLKRWAYNNEDGSRMGSE